MSWEEDECLYGWIFRACCCSMLTSQSDYYSNRAIARHGLQQAGGSKHITFPAIYAEEEQNNNNYNKTAPRPSAAADFFF
jgi:hypothetical protein